MGTAIHLPPATANRLPKQPLPKCNQCMRLTGCQTGAGNQSGWERQLWPSCALTLFFSVALLLAQGDPVKLEHTFSHGMAMGIRGPSFEPLAAHQASTSVAP